jgi:signal transduction histidine kinase
MQSLNLQTLSADLFKRFPGFKMRASMPNRHLNIFFAAKTRVLISYVILLVFSTVVSLLAIHQILISRLEAEIKTSLYQEIEEFRRLVKDGRNPKTGQPFGDNISAIFDIFLARNVPNDHEFFLALLNHEFYNSSHTADLGTLKLEPDRIKAWSQLTHPEENDLSTPAGPLHYLAEPVTIGKNHGVFVVVHLSAQEREKIKQVIIIVGLVEGIMMITALSSSLIWLAAGRILARLQLLTQTAHSISVSDLTQRIPIEGKDEITELTITFNEMLDRLEVAFASQRDFINDAGHELRTPITIIRCYLEQLNPDSQEQCEAVILMRDELNRMSRLVDDLLVLAKAKRPDFLNPEIIEIGSLTEEVYVKANALATRNWCLEVKGAGRLIADRQRLTQAILNLAQNAIQHTLESDRITFGSTLMDSNFRFWVSDMGEGIARAEQESIFKRFVRGSSNRRSEGVGLGLAIVRAIAQAHGGSVELTSHVGIGSTFTLVIPLEPPERMPSE